MDPEGVVHRDKPGGGGARGWWWQPELPGRKWGEATPPSGKWVKMFELAQLNLFTPEVKKQGASHWRFIAKCWQALGLGGDEVCGEDLDLDADVGGNYGDGGGGGSTCQRPIGGRMPDWCTASLPAPSPSPRSPQPLQLGDHRSRTPPTPGTPSPRLWGPSPPPLTGKARYVDCVLALI